MVIATVGFFLFLLSPLLAILFVRARGKVRPLTAFVAAGAGVAVGVGVLALSTYLGIRWEQAHTDGPQFFVFIGDPSMGRHVRTLGVLLLFACVVASLFLLGQWLVGRLTRARG